MEYIATYTDEIETVSVGSEKECPICYCEINNKNCCTTECGHTFCLKCILQTSYNNQNIPSCPLCRTELIESSSEESSEDDDSEYVEDDDEADAEDEYLDEFDIGIAEEGDNHDENFEEYDDEEYDLQKIAEDFMSKGYTVADIVSLLTCLRNVRSNNYAEGYTKKMARDFSEVLKEHNREITRRKQEQEQEQLANEDKTSDEK